VNTPNRKALEWAADEVQKYNPYHDRLGRFTSAHAAASTVPQSKTGVVSRPEVQNEYGVRLVHGGNYDLRVARRYRDPRTGHDVADVNHTSKVRGRVDFINDEGRVTITGRHAIGGYSPSKVKRSTFHLDAKDVIDAAPISRAKVVRGEVASLGSRASAAVVLATIGKISPRAAASFLDYGTKKYSTTEDRAAFAQIAARHVIPNSKLKGYFSEGDDYLPDHNFEGPDIRVDLNAVKNPGSNAPRYGRTSESSSTTSTPSSGAGPYRRVYEARVTGSERRTGPYGSGPRARS
jgi:hypothetical protein